jgi:type IV secretion system protein VirB11
MGHVTSEQLLTPLRPWLDDPGVTEIMMNKPGEVYIEKGGCIFRHTLLGFHVLHVMRALQLIANENEKIFNAQAPLLSGKLYDQSRIQAVLPPISRSVCFSIR